METSSFKTEEERKNVQQAVELALLHRDIDDLKVRTAELRTGQEVIEKEIGNLATQDDIKALKDQLDLLMPWAQTLQTLERMSKWIAALAAGAAVIIAAISWLKGGGGQ